MMLLCIGKFPFYTISCVQLAPSHITNISSLVYVVIVSPSTFGAPYQLKLNSNVISAISAGTDYTGDLSVQYQLTETGSQTHSLSATITTQFRPTITSATTIPNILENFGNDTDIYTITTNKNDATSYSLTGTDANKFSVRTRGRVGIVTLTENPDYDTKTSYSFGVVATKSGAANTSTTHTVTLNVNSDADEGTSGSDSLLITKSGTTSFIYDRDASSQLRLGAADNSGIVVIDGSGDILFGTTSTGTTHAYFESSSNSRMVLSLGSSTTTTSVIAAYKNPNGTVGTVSTNGSATSYNTSSDARLKDVTGQARGLDVINALNPVSYNWKADGKADEGLIAQEVLDVVPNAVSQNEEEYYQMDYSKLVTPLIKAVQELSNEVNELKQEIQNLKGE